MDKTIEYLIAFLSGLICTAVFVWFCSSCLEIAFNGFAGDLNAIKILFA